MYTDLAAENKGQEEEVASSPTPPTNNMFRIII